MLCCRLSWSHDVFDIRSFETFHHHFAGPGLTRAVNFEKASFDAQQRVERLEFDLNETTKVLQVRKIIKRFGAIFFG